MTPLRFVMLDDGTQVGEVAFARSVPRIGEGITLEPGRQGEDPRRFRVDDIDRGYIQAGAKTSTYKDSTVTVYLIDVNDPRREKP